MICIEVELNRSRLKVFTTSPLRFRWDAFPERSHTSPAVSPSLSESTNVNFIKSESTNVNFIMLENVSSILSTLVPETSNLK